MSVYYTSRNASGSDACHHEHKSLLSAAACIRKTKQYDRAIYDSTGRRLGAIKPEFRT